MVKPASDRIAKYTAKFDTTVIKARLDAVKDVAISKATNAFDDIAQMEADVQLVLNQDGILTVDRPKYYNCAREIWKRITNGLKDPSLTTWVDDTLGPKYISLGCTSATLVDIALDVFSITFTPPAP